MDVTKSILLHVFLYVPRVTCTLCNFSPANFPGNHEDPQSTDNAEKSDYYNITIQYVRSNIR